jgi:RNA polymerase sigma-70 factor, ECF subfamily
MSPEADGREQAPECFRAYLGLLARMQLDEALQGKVDLSGVVQQTLLEACQAQQRFLQLSDGQRVAWLRTALAHNLKDEVRKLGTARRDAGRERSLEAALEESSARLEAWLAADQSSPSDEAVRNELLLRLADALAQMPEDQRQAVELRHLRGYSLAEVAQQMGRSKGAAAKLIFRGIERLQALLPELGRG